MSNTLRDLVATSFQYGKSGKGVLTSQEAYIRALGKHRSVISISSLEDNVFFFSDDHIFGYKVMPKTFVPGTTQFPMSVAPRECVPDGIISTIEQYIEVFHKGQRQITSIEELAVYLDNLKEDKGINWQPEHFPVGTVVVLGDYKRDGDYFTVCAGGNAEVEVTECIMNGPDSWLIRTDIWNESLKLYKSFNFSHITGIKSRGTGIVKIQTDRSKQRLINLKSDVTYEPLSKNRYYCRYFQELAMFLVYNSHLPKTLSVKPEFIHFFYNQSFVKKTGEGYSKVIDFDKKKAKRFIHQNINRWIKPMKVVCVEQEALRKQEAYEYFSSIEKDWDRDYNFEHNVSTTHDMAAIMA